MLFRLIQEFRNLEVRFISVTQGFATVIDHAKLGYFSFRVYIKLRNISPQKRAELEDYLMKNKHIWWFVTIDGDWDLDFVVLVKDVYEFYPLWDEFASLFQRYIFRTEITVYSHIQRFPKAYLIGKENLDSGIIISYDRQLLKVDELDTKIMKEIAVNARFSLVELAKKAGSNVQTVRARIAAMEKKKIIAGYQVMIDLAKLGYKFYKSFFYLTDTTMITQMKAFAMMHPNIVFLNKNIGGADFELEFHVTGIEEFLAVMKQFISRFYEAIDHYYYFRVIEERKIIYSPEIDY